MVNITHIHLVGGERHEHIQSVRWTNPDTKESGESSRTEMVDWIKNKGGKAYVNSGGLRAEVGVVNANPPYIRTHADGQWNDNLLSLPHY